MVKDEPSQNGPLVLLSSSLKGDGAIALAAPGVTIATAVVRFHGDPTVAVVAVLTRSEVCATTSTDFESLLKRRTS
jgi:hypothetical protein